MAPSSRASSSAAGMTMTTPLEARRVAVQHAQQRARADRQPDRAGRAGRVGDGQQVVGEQVVVPAVLERVAVAVAAQVEQHPGALHPRRERPGLGRGPAQPVREHGDGQPLAEDGERDARDPAGGHGDRCAAHSQRGVAVVAPARRGAPPAPRRAGVGSGAAGDDLVDRAAVDSARPRPPVVASCAADSRSTRSARRCGSVSAASSRRCSTSMAATAPMTSTCAPGQAKTRSAPRPLLPMAMNAPPKLLRSTTVSRGTTHAA